MDKSTLGSRVRQLLAADLNAESIYADLARITADTKLKSAFSKVAADEARHVALCRKILSMLESG